MDKTTLLKTLLVSLADSTTEDIYTDAPECAKAVEHAQNTGLFARLLLEAQDIDDSAAVSSGRLHVAGIDYGQVFVRMNGTLGLGDCFDVIKFDDIMLTESPQLSVVLDDNVGVFGVVLHEDEDDDCEGDDEESLRCRHYDSLALEYPEDAFKAIIQAMQ